eukprot:163787_1
MDFFDEDSESEWSDDDQEVIGLFSNQTFDNIKSMLEDARNNYAFDFYGFQKKHKLDSYGCIRMINYIRSEIINNTNPETLVLHLLPQVLFLKDDKYYKPVLDNDALLMCSFELKDGDDNDKKSDIDNGQITIDESTNDDSKHRTITHKVQQVTDMIDSLIDQETQSLRVINQQLNDKINEMKTIFHRIVLEESYDDTQKQAIDEKQPPNDIDTWYFDSYSRTSVHEMMLRDKHRTLSYKNFIDNHKALFQDKIVMDIGCGTGVLSIFAAKAGAKHVIAVDMSDIAHKAKMIIKNNGFEDKITVIQSKVEDIKCLPHGIEKVDLIISEWMGYFLLYESMLSSVLFARDVWLNRRDNTHQIFPNSASLFMAGFDYDAMNLKFWQKECYDIDMTEMYQKPKRVSEPLIIEVDVDYIYTQYECFKTLDMHTANNNDLDFTSRFDLIGSKDGAIINALVVWFDCLFEKDKEEGKKEDIVCLTTSPENEVTHWYSTVFLLPQQWILNKSERIHVELNAARCEDNAREYTIFITLSRDNDQNTIRQVYNLNGNQ